MPSSPSANSASAAPATASRIDAEAFGEAGAGGAWRRLLGSDQLQVAERDRMEEHADASGGPRTPGDLFEHLVPLLGADGVGVPGLEPRSEPAQLLELRLDVPHGAAPIAVDDQQVHAVLGELLGRRQPEAARAAEDQRPAVVGEITRHWLLLPSKPLPSWPCRSLASPPVVASRRLFPGTPAPRRLRGSRLRAAHDPAGREAAAWPDAMFASHHGPRAGGG